MVSLTLEARDDLPMASSVQGRRVLTSEMGLALAPCLHEDPWFACLIGTVAQFAASGRAAGSPPERGGLVVRTGLRGGAELPLGGHLGLRIHADANLALVRVHLRSASREVWSTPLVSASAGGALLLHF
jgi:hypothetical protein